jgi:hypothetical protein
LGVIDPHFDVAVNLLLIFDPQSAVVAVANPPDMRLAGRSLLRVHADSAESCNQTLIDRRVQLQGLLNAALLPWVFKMCRKLYPVASTFAHQRTVQCFDHGMMFLLQARPITSTGTPDIANPR